MDGSQLKRWRWEHRLSQRDIAAKLHCSYSAVCRWEKGQDIPGPAQLLLRLLFTGAMPFPFEPSKKTAA